MAKGRGKGRGGTGVQVEGLNEFIAELRKLEGDTNWVKEFTKAERKIAKDIAAKSSAAAPGASAQAGHFASAIKGTATQGKGATIAVGGARTPRGKYRAAPAFWGRKSQGNWIGTGWDVGGGGGPYAINATINRESEAIAKAYGEAVEDVAKQAFND
jgi:hypothetical protein